MEEEENEERWRKRRRRKRGEEGKKEVNFHYTRYRKSEAFAEQAGICP